MPRGAVPTVGELEARIDEALVIARASEEGVREVGEMALDAARQARRAAEAAESASAAAVAAAEKARPVEPAPPTPAPETATFVEATPETQAEPAAEPEETPAEPEGAPEPPPRFDVRFRRFSERADRVSARLRALQDHPRHPAAPSAAAIRRRGDG